MNPQDELTALTDLFPDDQRLIEKAEHIPPAITPEPYKQMLVHDQHMTVTMEAHYSSPVDVRILDRKLDGDVYSRKILLLKTGTDRIVQFGIVRFDFRYVTPEIRDEIVRGDTPLGRILIDHGVLRHIDLGAILRITVGPALADYLKMKRGDVTFGRLATIFCDHQPAVDLFEVPAPLT